MNTIGKNATIIRARFIDALLSDKIALSRLGVATDTSQVESARELLDIEAKAKEQKQKKQKTIAEFKDYVNEYFHDALFEHLEDRVADSDFLFNEILNVESSVAGLFDACVARATGASQLSEIIGQMSWLTRDVLNLVNNPPFRDLKSDKPHVQDVGLAVRYVGVDNIKFALLTYVGKNWLPHSTEPYSEFKNKYWQYALACANCARELAPDQKVDPTLAYLFGLVHGIGLTISLRLYLRAFDSVRIAQMKKVLNAGRKDIEKVLDTLQLDHNFVSDALNKFWLPVSHKLFEHLSLKFAILAPFCEELIQHLPFKDASPMTQTLMQAQTFVQYKMLQKSRLIELDEAKLFLTHASINNSVLTKLNQVNLKKLDLKPKD